MHCPDCGQKQISDETSFCSRCGLPLRLVAEVVHHRGTLPQLAELKKKKNFLSRKAGIFIGISWILFFVLVVTVLLDILGAPGEITSLAAVFGIFSGIMIIVGAVFFLKGETDDLAGDEYPDQGQRGLNSSQLGTLPPQQFDHRGTYVGLGKSRWETNDLVRPSVTEGTTRLLRDEDQ
jgi:hypothetical protein